MKEVETRSDIDFVIAEFYKKAMGDKNIGHFFTTVVTLDLEHHLPVIGAFWESILFRNNAYSGNPMEVHMKMHAKSEMKQEHFDRWLYLLEETIDEHFEGELAHAWKTRAKNIATVMLLKTRGVR